MTIDRKVNGGEVGGRTKNSLARTRLLPQWALSNTTAAAALISAAAVAFFTTWFLLSPFAGQVNRTVLTGLIVGNVAIAAGFAVLIGVRLWHVLSERRHQLAGSRTHLQLVGIFSVLAVIPAVIAFLFAFTILRAGLNDVFSERVENYQETARDLARGLIDYNSSEAEQMMREIAFDIHRQEEANIGFEQTPISFRQYIFAQAQIRGLSALYLMDGDLTMLIRAELAPDRYNLPPTDILNAIRAENVPAGQFVFGVNDAATYDMFRSVIRLEDYNNGFLIAYYRIDPQTTARIIAARAVVSDWDEAQVSRTRFERVFLAGYITLAIIILFGAIWAAIWAASRLVQPIGRLVNMAESVSAGDLGARVDVLKEDGEFGVLARAMNHMTGQVQTQRDDLIDTNRQFDERRRFTEAVLSSVSAGVIGLNADGRITIANRSAADLLGGAISGMTGSQINDLMPELSDLFERALYTEHREVGDQIELSRNDRMRTLNVRIAKDIINGEKRFVATFDDISQLISAQRNAAWGDVARRIAHEIKNPLTPIQLSAERLRRKYRNEIVSNPDVFEKCTDTIVRQVNDIGRMVDEFSSFARMPKPVIDSEDIREIIRSAVFPQRVAFPEIDFNVNTPDVAVLVDCDDRLIVQALSNLLKNAGESIQSRLSENEVGARGKINVAATRLGERVEISITDNGKGLPATERHRLTEPYMTTRAKGTGLGLAIVKKVVEEHGGTLGFGDDTSLGPTGARITVTLPCAEDKEQTEEHPAAAE